MKDILVDSETVPVCLWLIDHDRTMNTLGCILKANLSLTWKGQTWWIE